MISELFSKVGTSGLGTIVDRFWSLPSEADKWWCAVTTWHSDGVTLEDALTGGQVRVNLVECLREVAVQLRSIHEAGFAHGDVSLSNILITERGSVHLIDLEYVTNGHFLNEAQPFLTLNYSHPDRLAKIRTGNYTIGDAQVWDRYALGQVFLQVIADADPYRQIELDLFTQRALRLVGCLLLDGVNTVAETAIGLDTNFLRAEKYESLTPVIDALDRVLGRAAPESQVPELSAVPPEIVQIGLREPAAFTPRVRALTKTAEMRQINTCLQLGLICLVWPTATHTRLEHALGTYGVMRSAIINLNADPQSPVFKVLGTPKVMKLLLAAALLHDVGHYPLAHDLEEAYPDPFKHEDRSIHFITQSKIAAILKRPEGDLEKPGWGIDPVDVASVVEGKPLEGSSLSHWMCDLLHSMLSGALDVDKIDYLVRDSNALGVAAGGGIDVPRVLSSLTIAVVPSGSRKDQGVSLRLAVRAKGIRPAELVGRVRSHMFGVAYWHRSYRSIKAMIHWLVWESMLVGGREPAQLKREANAIATQLFSSIGVSPAQLPTFELRVPQGFRIPQRESEVLYFLNQYGQERASSFGNATRAALFALLQDHSWYRAVLTIDHYENLEVSDPQQATLTKSLWTKLDRLTEFGRQRSYEEAILAKMSLSKLVQQKIVRSVGADPTTITRILDPLETLDSLIADAASIQLFMVDFPEKRKSKEEPLYFLASERPGSRLTDTAQAIPVRRSFDQNQLQSEFLVSNGAIRLFCHPKYARFIEGSLSAAELQRILEESADELLASLGRGGPGSPRR